MKLLFDTHLLIWAAIAPDKLPAGVATLMSDPETEPLFSAASIWEVVIKSGLGRSDFAIDARLLRQGLLENGYKELAITGEHALAVSGLPELHKDPFDRILVAQAMIHGIPLVTADRQVAEYPGPIHKV
jgi:PIN domain nuclease of toxin-antitoxin system